MNPRMIVYDYEDLAEAACCGVDGGADDVARDNQLDPAILLAAC
jgi:hypothetical protein